MSLPDDLARERNRFIGYPELAGLYNQSIPHARRLVRLGKLPQPVCVGGRKKLWRLGTVLDDIASRCGQEAA